MRKKLFYFDWKVINKNFLKHKKFYFKTVTNFGAVSQKNEGFYTFLTFSVRKCYKNPGIPKNIESCLKKLFS